ncbi:MAG: InlB B-repeat-containing protein, partial [Clostridia bacterium]|nr:InlB B-repeat-containing protein [Clostridia bacterium]
VTITINKDGSAYSNSTIKVALYQDSTKKYGETTCSSSSTVSFSTVTAGTYTVWASHSTRLPGTLQNTGVSVTVSGASTTGTVNYYTLTKSQGTGTTLTIKTVNSSGTAMSNGDVVRQGAAVYETASLNDGYKSLVTDVYRTSASGTKVTVTSNVFTMPAYGVTVASSATPNTYTAYFVQGVQTGSAASTRSKSITGGSAGVTKFAGTNTTASNQSTTVTYAQSYTLAYDSSKVATGYTFAGWYIYTSDAIASATLISGSNVASYSLAYNYAGNRYFYALFTANSYTAYFVQALDGTKSTTGGSSAFAGTASTASNQSKTVYYATAYTLTASASAGYTFAGWYIYTSDAIGSATLISGSNVASYSLTYNYTGNRYFYAKFTANSYNVTLKAGTGTTTCLTSNGTFNATDKTSTVSTGSTVTLYAKPNSGYNAPTFSVTSGTATLSAVTNSSGTYSVTASAYTAAFTVTASATAKTYTVTLYVFYESTTANSYTAGNTGITCSEGSYASSKYTISNVTDTRVTAKTLTVTRQTGFTSGTVTWYSGTSSSGTNLGTGTTSPSLTVTADTNFAAYVTRNRYTVTLTNGTGISGTTGGGTYLHGTSVAIDATVKAGYTWSKWTVTSSGADASTTKAWTATSSITSNLGYTANTTANSYNVTLKAGTGTTTCLTSNGTFNATDKTSSVSTGSTVTLYAKPNSGYNAPTFSVTSGTATLSSVTNNSGTYSVTASAYTAAFTVTASATAKTYTVTVYVFYQNAADANYTAGNSGITITGSTTGTVGGYNSTNKYYQITGVTDSNANSNSTTITATKQTGFGSGTVTWYSGTSSSGTSLGTGDTKKISVTADTNIAAYVTRNTYTVSYYSTSTSSTYTTGTYRYNQTYSLPTAPTATGYTFIGWSTSNDNSTDWTSGDKTCTAATSWYAVWKKVWTFNDTSSSTVTDTVNYKCSDASSSSKSYSKTNPSLSGYTFDGYATSNTTTSSTAATTTSTSVSSTSATPTFYAVWRNTSGTRSVDETLNHAFRCTSTSSNTHTATTTKTTPYTGVTKYFSYNLGSNRTATTGGTAGQPTYTTLSSPHTFGSTSTETGRTSYTFVGWATSSTATSASWSSGTATPTSGTTYYAVYSKTITKTLTYNANGHGTAPSNSTGTATQTYNCDLSSNGGNKTISVTTRGAMTADGYTHTSWNTMDDNSGTTYNLSTAYNFTCSADSSTTLYGYWTINSYTIKVYVFYQNVDNDNNTAGNTGLSISGGTWNSTGKYYSLSYDYNATPTLTASRNTGFTSGTVTWYSGTSISGTGTTGTTKSITVTADANYAVTVTRNTYTLTIDTSDAGISSATGAGTYRYQKVVSIDATVASHYNWSAWTVTSGNTPASTSTKSTTVTITQATTLKPTTYIDTYTVSFYASEGSWTYLENCGTVSPSSITLPYGTKIYANGLYLKRDTNDGTTICTATPTAPTTEYEYSLRYWGSGSTTLSTTQYVTVTSDMTVTAYFDGGARNYTVTLNTISGSSYAGSPAYSESSFQMPYDSYLYVSHDGSTVAQTKYLWSSYHANVYIYGKAASAQYVYYPSSYLIHGTTTYLSTASGYNITGDITIDVTFSQATRYYAVTLAVNNSNYGYAYSNDASSTCSVTYGTTIYANGATLRSGSSSGTTIAWASPFTNCQFASWTSGGTTLSTSTYITVTSAVTVTANFTYTATYTVTFARNNTSYGTVSPTSATVTAGTKLYANGYTVRSGSSSGTTLSTASPATDYDTFTSWTSGGTTLSTSTYITVNSDVTVTANFTHSNSRTITFTRNNTSYGTISATSYTVTAGSTIWLSRSNKVVKLTNSSGTTICTATPATQTAQHTYSLSSWNIGSTAYTSNTTYTVNDDITVTATFAYSRRYYTVSFVSNNTSYGTVSTSVPSYGFAYGTKLYANSNTIRQTTGSGTTRCTATANTGYSFSYWSSGGSTISSGNYVYVTGEMTITANFISNVTYYTVTVSTSTASYDYGSNTYTYTPASFSVTSGTVLYLPQWVSPGVAYIRQTNSSGTILSTLECTSSNSMYVYAHYVNGSWYSNTTYTVTGDTTIEVIWDK